MKIHLRKTDKLFTEIMRKTQDFTCQRCGTKYVIDGVAVRSLQNLGVSHYWVRNRENTRFDLENCDLLCNLPCHRLWEGEDREKYTEFMIKKLGQGGFDLLMVRAHTYKKRDDFFTSLELGEMKKGLN